jgi:uncharacterized protein
VKNLVLSGDGLLRAVSVRVVEVLAWESVGSSVTEDLESGLARLAGGAYDLLTLNVVEPSVSEAGRAAVRDHLAGGGGILALRPAVLCFRDWAGWPGILGAVWDGGRSRASGLAARRISVRTGAHTITAGLGDFWVVDDVYEFLDQMSGSEPLAVSAGHGVDHPVWWCRQAGGGRVVYDGLGYDDRSLSHPAHRVMLCRAARWLLGMSHDREVEMPEEPEEEEEEERPSP